MVEIEVDELAAFVVIFGGIDRVPAEDCTFWGAMRGVPAANVCEAPVFSKKIVAVVEPSGFLVFPVRG